MIQAPVNPNPSEDWGCVFTGTALLSISVESDHVNDFERAPSVFFTSSDPQAEESGKQAITVVSKREPTPQR